MLSRSLEVSTTAAANYLDILEGALLIRRLQPFHANIRKRLVKSPKLYIRDGLRMCPVEVKLGIEIPHYDTAGLRRCMEDLGMERGFMVTRAEETRSLGRGVYSLPLEQLAAGAVYPWTY